MTGEPMQTASKALRARVYQLLSENQSSHYAFLPAMFNPSPKSTNQESNCVIKVASMKNTENFLLRRVSHHV